MCFQTQTQLFERPASGGLPPEPPWPGQEGCGNGFSGDTWQLLHADSVLPINIKRGESERRDSHLDV